MKQFDTIQGLGKDNMDAAMKSVGALSKGMQAVAAEVADYAKRSFEQGSAMAEKLAGARTLERAMEIQTEYARGAYEGFVAQAGKLGDLAVGTAKDAFSPVESVFSKAPASA